MSLLATDTQAAFLFAGYELNIEHSFVEKYAVRKDHLCMSLMVKRLCHFSVGRSQSPATFPRGSC